MHSFVAIPIVYPLISAIVVYGVGLPIVTAHPTSLAATIVTSVLWYLYTIAFWVFTYLFVREYFDERIGVRVSLIGFFNTLFVAIHMVACMGMTFWLLDPSSFMGVGPTLNPYGVYFAEFLPTGTSFVLGGGFVTLRPAEGSYLAAIWSLYGSIIGLVTIVLVFTFVSRSVTRRIYTGGGAGENKMKRVIY